MKIKIIFQVGFVLILSVQAFSQKKGIPGNGTIQPSLVIYGTPFTIEYHWISQGPYPQILHKKTNKTRVTNPVIGSDFDAIKTQGITSDNSIAISNKPNRMVVQLDLEHVEFNNQALTSPTTTDYYSWVNGSAISLPATGKFLDPRVIYDPEKDKFVAAVLWDDNTYNSKIFILTSTDGDPNNSWQVFSIDAPLNEWFDYTQIGMSSEDFFIPLEIHPTLSNTPLGTNIFQIPKSDLYSLSSGSILSGKTFSTIKNIKSQPTHICPVTNGEPTWNSLSNYYGDGCYLISYGDDGTNSQFSIYDIIYNYSQYNGTTQTPTLNIYSASYPAIIPQALNSNQLGTNIKLKANDQRVTSSYHIKDKIIFSLQGADINSQDYSQIYLFRLDMPTLTTSGITIPPNTTGTNAEFYNAPFISHNGTTLSDQSTSLVFSVSSTISNPYLVTCNIDDGLLISNLVTVRTGDNYIDDNSTSTTNLIKWCDYSGIQRVYDDPCTRNYLTGTFGELSNTYCSNYAETLCSPESINEIEHNTSIIFPNPVNNILNIELEKENINKIQLIDCAGKIVLEQNVKSNKAKINVSEFATGYYLLKINTENGNTFSHKIIHFN